MKSFILLAIIMLGCGIQDPSWNPKYDCGGHLRCGSSCCDGTPDDGWTCDGPSVNQPCSMAGGVNAGDPIVGGKKKLESDAGFR